MTRSTEECEISRSCQRATFSNAACALARTTRARPQICSQVTGLRLCGMAELPFWPLRKVFLSLAHFGALQVADFEGDLFQTGRQHRKSGHEVRVAVPLYHLRGNRRRTQSQLFTDRLFDLGADVREGSDGARDLAHAHVFRRGLKAPDIAAGLFVPDGELQPKGDGLGMHSVGAADLRPYAGTQARGV